MATTAELRSLITSLADEAEAYLATLWAQLQSVRDVRDGLTDVLPTLVDEYADASALVAAEWYVEYRDELNIGGVFAPELPDLNLGAGELVDWGVSLIDAEDADWDAALVRISGGLERRVAKAGRETISTATFDDPQATGWQRQARPGACGFCSMLAARGSVYRTRDTAIFGAHDHCHCLAVPAFDGHPVPVKPYTPTSRSITDADRALTRAWIKANL